MGEHRRFPSFSTHLFNLLEAEYFATSPVDSNTGNFMSMPTLLISICHNRQECPTAKGSKAAIAEKAPLQLQELNSNTDILGSFAF